MRIWWIVALVVLACSAEAQPPKPAAKEKPRTARDWEKELKITPEQKAKLKSLQTRYNKMAISVSEQQRGLKPSDPRRQQLIIEQRKLQQDLLQQILAVYTPEQRAKIEARTKQGH